MPRAVTPRSDRTRVRAPRPAVQEGSVHAARARQHADAVRVLQYFRELFRIVQQHFQSVETECGVSGAQLWALVEVDRQPGMKVSEVAAVLSVQLPTASNMLDKLSERGFIRRERIARDRRVVRVFLTAEGRKCLRKAPKPAQGILPDVLQRMPAATLRRLARDLDLLLTLSSVRTPDAALRHLSEP